MSNLFHFFLLQSDGVTREPIERKVSDLQEKPEKATEQEDVSTTSGGYFLLSAW